MATQSILRYLSQLMDEFQKVGTHCVITKGDLTLSIDYSTDDFDRSEEKVKFEKVMAKIIGYSPVPECPYTTDGNDYLNYELVTVNLNNQCIDIEVRI